MIDGIMVKVKITRKQASQMFARLVKVEKQLRREQKRVSDYQETVLFLTAELMLNDPKKGKDRLSEFCKASTTTAATIEQFLADAGFYYGDESDVERIDRDAQP